MVKKTPKQASIKTIMGIDPGTNFTGYGVLEVRDDKPKCIVLGHINLSSYKDPYQKLRHIFEQTTKLIDKYKPDEVALEAPFYGENVQSMLKLGRAQGVAMAAALTKDIPVFEYAPRRIKQSITGNGGASKEQVASLLKSILKVEFSSNSLDASDGLAVALCHHFESSSAVGFCSGKGGESNINAKLKSLASGKRSSSWEKFVSKNPERQVENNNGRHSKSKRSVVIGKKTFKKSP